MKLKRIAVLIPLLFGTYVLAGIGLIAAGVINRFYFLPGWSFKGPHADQSGVAVDGPIYYQQNQWLISKSLVPVKSGVAVRTDSVRLGRPAYANCLVAATGQRFRVPLRATTPVPPDTYPPPERLLAVSDIEGNFQGFASLLRGTGVVDVRLNWQFGRGHLVLVGDFFDRGLNVTECLWLIYKLEQEAAQAGGQVHLILGNHERMNLTGQYKYVRRKYRVNADTFHLPYRRWYDRHSVLGRWLRSKNVVEKIGSVIFVHGGLSPEVAAQHFTLGELNTFSRLALDTPAAALPARLRLAVQPPSSPDWYRGLVQQEPTESQVIQVLRVYEATTIVVGHTPVKAITSLYRGKVIAIDLPHQKRTDAGQPLQALLWQDKAWQVIDSRRQRQALR